MYVIVLLNRHYEISTCILTLSHDESYCRVLGEDALVVLVISIDVHVQVEGAVRL